MKGPEYKTHTKMNDYNLWMAFSTTVILLSIFSSGTNRKFKIECYWKKKLRVIDASSIMPWIVSGNTNAACVLIGEKGADMIIQEYGTKSMKKVKDELWNTNNLFSFS